MFCVKSIHILQHEFICSTNDSYVFGMKKSKKPPKCGGVLDILRKYCKKGLTASVLLYQLLRVRFSVKYQWLNFFIGAVLMPNWSIGPKK